MEIFYILLITNKASNIVEDLDTIRLLSKVIPSVTGTTNNLTEEKVNEKSFDLLFSFDEIITAGGYREPINLQQIRTNMEMESHEEKLVLMIKQSKQDEAKKQQESAIEAMKKKARENAKLGRFGGGDSTSFSSDNSSSGYNDAPSAFTAAPVSQPVTPVVPVSRPQTAVKGMSLGGAKNKNIEDALMKEDNLVAPVMKSKSSSASAAQEAAAPVVNAVQHPIMLEVSETVSATMTRDGALEVFEIKGSLSLTAATDDAALCSVQLRQSNTERFQFTTHPKINKAVYEKSGLLQLKDANKGFPSGRPVGILKWNYSDASNDELVPIKINCWPEQEGKGNMNVSIEYSMDVPGIELHDVKIRIPLGTSNSPNVVNVDGAHKYNAAANELIWTINMIDKSNASGGLEFNIQSKDDDGFFPIGVEFSSQQLFCNVEVTSVKSVNGNAPIQYGIISGMSSDEYSII